MKGIKRLAPAVTVLSLLLMSLASHAHAQYVWIDKNDVRNYSDRPPPTSTPASRILKVPRESGWTEDLYKEEPEAAPTNTKSAKRPTLAEKEADYKKRRLDRIEKEKAATEARKQALRKAEHCASAREYQKTLNSGIRITRADGGGQRSYMTDKQRAQEQREVRRVLANCK